MKKARPFIKWVGGKTKLLDQLDALLPADFGQWEEATYIEPFVGGGAMLFHLLNRFPNINRAVINDINPDLISCYQTIKETPEQLIEALRSIQDSYSRLQSEEERKRFYLKSRTRYNEKNLNPIDNTTLFFFLNRTCFNGLYRVNKKGLFNVPFGRYSDPQIFDEETLREDSRMLQNVQILSGDFEETLPLAGPRTLFYFDPPYRPLSETSAFTSYSKESFNDDSQLRLKFFCDKVNEAGHAFLLSNSDSQREVDQTSFFDTLYKDYHICRVNASRSINSNPTKRGKISEILIRNYPTS